MNTYKVETILNEDGTLVLQGLPFQAGTTVEVIVLERPELHQEKLIKNASEANTYSLRGRQPYQYDDPFGPATSLDEWEALN